jgi:hypothetical protein
MRGLNIVLLICMGLSFGEVVERSIGVASGIFFCIANGAKFLCVVNVGS